MSQQHQTDDMSDVEWPADFERTPPGQRERTRKFEVSLAKTFDQLEAELERIGVDDFRYSFDAKARQRDGRPYANARPDDPSFVLRWSMEGDQYAVACDQYTKLRDNVRAVYLYLGEKRKMEGRPVTTGQSEFATARLPPGDPERESVVVRRPPHEVLDLDPDEDREHIIKAAAKALKAEHHPDSGGDPDMFKQVVKAEEEMLDG